MDFSRLLAQRAEMGRPIVVALIGAGKFGTMFLAQARRTRGIHVAAVVDLSVDQACGAMALTGWPHQSYAAPDLETALTTGATYVTDNAFAMIESGQIDVVVECTGRPVAAIEHALACLKSGKHLINVTIEADVLAGPWLARQFSDTGLVYSLAYGDQPALIAEMVDWARTSGFSVACAGKGMKYRPEFRHSTPETVWEHYGIGEERAAESRLNPYIFNSFVDGTQSAIELACVANACDLAPQPVGLRFPACGVDDLPQLLRPRRVGGLLDHRGTVEVVSSIERDGRPVFKDLRWGVYVVIEAGDEYIERCFADYGMKTDDTGRFAALHRPNHLIGLELGLSIASVGLMRCPTGMPTGFRGDVVAAAKRDLPVGERLDGVGGYTVYGKLVPASTSLSVGGLPFALAHKVTITEPVERDEVITWSHVSVDEHALDVRVRRQFEAAFRPVFSR